MYVLECNLSEENESIAPKDLSDSRKAGFAEGKVLIVFDFRG